MTRKKPSADPDTHPKKAEDVSTILKARRDRERDLRGRTSRGVELCAEDAAFIAKADEEIGGAALAVASTPPKSPELARAENVLDRILAAFAPERLGAWPLLKDMSGPKGRRRMTLARGTLPDDAYAYERLRRKELAELAAFFADVLRSLDDVRARLWPPGSEEYARRWATIIRTWNLRVLSFATIPTLCEICGAPIFARPLNDGLPPTVCSEEHRLVLAQRESRAKKSRRTP